MDPPTTILSDRPSDMGHASNIRIQVKEFRDVSPLVFRRLFAVRAFIHLPNFYIGTLS